MLKKLLPLRNGYVWRFFRAGGLDQVRLDTGADIANLEQLDQKLWVALACPVKGLEFDERTLTLLDTDNDGRLRVPEILAGVKFCSERLNTLDVLVKGGDTVQLASLNTATQAGKVMLSAAQKILKAQKKDGATALSLSDVANTQEILAAADFNGDGVIAPVAAHDDAAVAKVMGEILDSVGGTPDRGGITGVAQANVDAFFAELTAFDAWHKAAEAKAAELLPLGAKTFAVAAAVAAVKPKVDDYFTRCRLAAFDVRALAAVNRSEDEYLAAVAKDMAITADEVVGFPLARVEAGRALPLVTGVNPAWATALSALVADAVVPILGAKTELTQAEWEQIQAKLAAHFGWAAAKPATKVEPLGIARVREILASDAKARLDALIAKDKACEDDFNALVDLEKLVRLQRDFYTLLKNFVSFAQFYEQEAPAVFQSGALFLDTRSCNLCVRVEDAAKHAAMTGLSKCYLAYCDLTRKSGEKRQIAALFGNGDGDYLMVGRNGIFYDRQGLDWDATITKIVDSPISIRQAFFAPYKKAIRFVDEFIAKRAAAAADAAPAPGAAPAGGLNLSSIALIGVAVSGFSAVIGGLLQVFFGLGFLMPLGLVGLVLAVSGPSMIIAAIKLRQRNLGPILDANGWAINSRVKVNIPLGSALTELAQLPEGAARSFSDPFKPKRTLWQKIMWFSLAAVVLILFSACATVFSHHMNLLPRETRKPLWFLGVPTVLTGAKTKWATAVGDLTVELKGKKEVVAGSPNFNVTPGALDALAGAKKEYEDLKAKPAVTEAEKKALGRAEATAIRAQHVVDNIIHKLDLAVIELDKADDALFDAEMDKAKGYPRDGE